MRNIEVQIINPEAIRSSEYAMQAAARLTQRGEKIEDMEDFLTLYRKPLNRKLISDLCELPHVTLQKFGVINIMVTGLSRRALAQITRHQNEVKFMSSSLQYSDYSKAQRFVMPPDLSERQEKLVQAMYTACAGAYDQLIKLGCTPDQAGYVMPQGLKGALLISATPYEWKHMISQRTCKRNTPEVRLIYLKIWGLLDAIAPELFGDAVPACLKTGTCPERKLSCGKPVKNMLEELEALR